MRGELPQPRPPAAVPPPRHAAVLSFTQLGYLVALAETLNFTRAAALCFVTQSTLSAGIRELERALGVALFERDRRRVLATPIGHQLAGRARALLSEAADFVGTARGAARPLEGALTLGVIPTIAPFLLPPLLRALRAELPRLETVVREARTDELLGAVEAGAVDFALIALPYDTGSLERHRLFSESLWLVGARADPAVRPASPAIGQVDVGRLMLLSEGHCLREHSLQACRHGRRGRERAPSPIEASSLPTLVQMVEAGLGVALLPEMAVRAGILAGSEVVARPLAAPAPSREIALVARPTTARRELLARIGELARRIGGGVPGPAARRPGPQRPRKARVRAS